MAQTLIKAPATAQRGEIIEVHTTISHEMETGFRPGDDGKILPRNIITLFSCHYNDELVFEVADRDVGAVVGEVTERMQSAADLDVPLVVDVGTGSNWDEAH